MSLSLLNPRKWWLNISVSTKLYVVVGIMAVLIATELFTLLFAMNTLSAVRALVGGESLWSKAQKNAVLEILNYAHTGDAEHFDAFKNHIQVPLGDHQARVEMEKGNMDINVVREGFLKGQIHPEDIDPVIRLLLQFHSVSYISKAIDIWEKGDKLMFELIETAEGLHVLLQQDNAMANRAQAQLLVKKIAHINDELTDIENQFSYNLGVASRWLEHLLVILLIIAVATVEATGLALTITFSRGLTRALKELNDFAVGVGAGDLSHTLPVRSKDELGQLAAALNTMMTDLKARTFEQQIAEKSNQIKSLFLANMSHEIRTPLNAILGFAEILKDSSLSTADRNRYLEIIERTGYNLATIINDILDISKVEAGKMELEKSVCSLPQILNDIEFLLRLRSEGKDIYLKFNVEEIPDYVVTDSTRLKQILLNIIGNAIKFTSNGGVTVSIKTKDNNLLCTVQDTGVGIPAQSRDKLFQPFSQVDLSIRKTFGGTGLGLVLSKRLAQQLGGDVILLNSEVGVGSTFLASIMFENAKKDEIDAFKRKLSSPPVKSQALRNMKILLVEDSVDNQLLAQQLLTKEGAVVNTVVNGQEAMEFYANNSDHQLILMDMQMPVMDGYSATSQLRKMGCRLPIIALTAHTMKEDLQKCLNAGCDSYVSKPFRRDELVNVILDSTALIA